MAYTVRSRCRVVVEGALEVKLGRTCGWLWTPCLAIHADATDQDHIVRDFLAQQSYANKAAKQTANTGVLGVKSLHAGGSHCKSCSAESVVERGLDQKMRWPACKPLNQRHDKNCASPAEACQVLPKEDPSTTGGVDVPRQPQNPSAHHRDSFLQNSRDTG